MKFNIKKFLWKTFKITGITLVSFVALVFLVPYLFPQAVNSKIKEWANNNIDGNIAFSRTGLSFFKRFPALTLTMYDVALKGSAPFEKDTLIAAKEISFGIDVSSVFQRKITINKIFLNEAYINVEADTAGHANYNIYKPKTQAATAVSDTNGASLGISQILIEKSRLAYNDQSIPMTINARGFNYSGSGDLSKDIFDLNSHTDIQSFDFYFNKQPYIISKKINADLITKINTQSLTFIFEKNNLNINQLPVEFNGRFGFLKDGYDMNFNIDSHENDLSEIITALPADYQKLLAQTQVSGTGVIQIALTGQYIAATNTKPDLSLSVKVRNGFISNQKSPSPIRNLYLDMDSRLPGLNTDSLTFNIDSLYFNIADGYLSSVVKVKGMTTPEIVARVNSEIDLEKWDKAIGIQPFHMKGKYSMHLQAEGRYATGIEHHGLRKTDTVITSIPKFSLQSTFRDGYFKYNSLPQAVSDIRFNLRAECADNNYKHISVVMDSLNALALHNYIRGYFKLGNMLDFPIDSKLEARIHLDDLKQIYPIDSLEMRGDLIADVTAKGNYQPEKKKYPAAVADISMKDGYIKTKYYPHPIENIQISTNITDETGSINGLNVSVKPISFSFENQPFALKAELHNFTDLQYNINLQGTLDIGKIYQVFAIKGYDVSGLIAANLSLKGKQSDAVAGHYDKLQNHGSLKVKELSCTTEMYPKPFLITRGDFSFNQDKMKLDTFTVKYANSVIVLGGAVSNVIDYVVKPGSVLKGALTLKSNMLVVDDFMAFADTSKSTTKTSSSASGVVMVPKNLDLTFNADVKKVRYSDLVLTDAKCLMTVKDGTITLKETGFNLVDAPVTMDATYTGIDPMKAAFDYHITSNDFDIKKAYKTVKLFRDMCTAAASAEGLISLDYHLSGKLNSGMMPVYPSLKGGGVVSAKKIKMHGFKLFNSIGKEARQDSLGGNPDVSKVELKTTIANNIITIERTKMRIAGFRARFEGQVSFNKALNLKFRLGLPPMGIIGIPMTITGTQDKPDIHLGKGKEDELQGTADNED